MIISEDGSAGSLPFYQDTRIYAGLFDGPENAKQSLRSGHKGYVHVARGKISVNGHALQAGDALKTDGGAVELKDGKGAEVLVFDLA